MQKKLFLFLLLFAFYGAKAQYCPCPKEFVSGNGNATKFFSLGRNKLGLCGEPEVQGKDTIYSEFALFECGQDTAIEFWGALQPCKLQFNKDTLTVLELYWLPIGENFDHVSVPFYTNKYYYDKDGLKHFAYFRKDIAKYSQADIDKVIGFYNKCVKENSERNVDVAYMLLWAYISGSKDAEVYLNGFKEKYGPFDGAIAEEWDDIIGTYSLYKQKIKISDFENRHPHTHTPRKDP